MHRLSTFLILLLLSNSSLALEILTHDSHQHNAAQVDQHAMHDMHTMAVADAPKAAASSSDPASESCICDDICCLSSIDFGLAANDEPISFDDGGLVFNSDFYSSISLDLFLPPPTR